MRRVLALGMGEVRMALKERAALFWMFVMPLVFIGVFGTFMGGESAPQPILLNVDDQDSTFLSARFVGHLKSEGFSITEVGRAEREGGGDQATGDQAVSGSESDDRPEGHRPEGRLLVIPEGFEDSLAAGHRVAVRYSAGRRGSPEGDTAAEIHIRKATARVLSTLAEMQMSRSGGASGGAVAKDTAAGGATAEDDVSPLPVKDPAFQESYTALEARPDPVQVYVTTAGKGRAVPSGFAASAPAMLVLFMLINTVIQGAVLLTLEKQTGCLQRLRAQPISRLELLIGKLSGGLLLAMLQAAVLLVAGRLLFHVYWGPNIAALLAVLFCLGLACSALGLLIGALLRTPEQASAVGWIFPLFLGAIGGTWWPLEIVPQWMQILGHFSPAAWAMDGLHGLISFGKGGGVVLIPCLVLLAYAAVFLAVGARSLRSE